MTNQNRPDEEAMQPPARGTYIEMAEEALERAIDQGELRPGQRLVPKHLADQLGVPRAQVVRALERLEPRALVQSIRKGKHRQWHVGGAEPEPEPEGVVDQAEAALSSRIESGELEPGAKIVQAEYAELLGLGANAVRTAMKRLEERGLVTRDGTHPKGLYSVAGTPTEPRFTSADELADWLGRRIKNGELEPGQLLPRRPFVKHHHLTWQQVNDALRALVREGLARRSGERFLVADPSNTKGREEMR